MKTISLWEPWATAMQLDLKRNETRHWYTDYRGPLAIHAAKTRDHADFIFDPEVYPHFAAKGICAIEHLQFGCVLCTVNLVGCYRTEDISPTPLERALGDYTPGRFAWVTENLVVLPKPVPARGFQSFWDWQPDGSIPNQLPLL